MFSHVKGMGEIQTEETPKINTFQTMRKEVSGMAVFRIEKTRDYTVISNHHLRNTDLSLKAKGLLSLMLSLPEDWDYGVNCAVPVPWCACSCADPKQLAGCFCSRANEFLLDKCHTVSCADIIIEEFSMCGSVTGIYTGTILSIMAVASDLKSKSG